MNKSRTHTNGFTLIELLVAVAISAILILAVNTVLYNAFNLRDRAYDSMDGIFSQQYAFKIMKQDILNAIAPNGTLAGDLYGENNAGDVRESGRLSLYTTTGKISESQPWSEIQKVEYSLMELSEYGEEQNYFLVRTINRNLSTTIEEEPVYYPLLSKVQSLRFSYYDGESWLNTWEPESQETPLPNAIRAEIILYQFQDEEQPQSSKTISRNLTIPIFARSFTLVPSNETEEEQGADNARQNTNQPEEENSPPQNPSGGGRS